MKRIIFMLGLMLLVGSVAALEINITNHEQFGCRISTTVCQVSDDFLVDDYEVYRKFNISGIEGINSVELCMSVLVSTLIEPRNYTVVDIALIDNNTWIDSTHGGVNNDGLRTFRVNDSETTFTWANTTGAVPVCKDIGSLFDLNNASWGNFSIHLSNNEGYPLGSRGITGSDYDNSWLKIDYTVPSLSGRVLDGATLGAIVTLPTIELRKGSYYRFDIADINGYYSIDELESGTYNYTVTEPGYNSAIGTITLEADTILDVLLFSSSLNTSSSSLDLSFLNDDNSPFINETIRFKYESGLCGGGCASLVGREYFLTTNSRGKVSANLANGEYQVDKINHQIKRNIDDFYAERIYFQFYSDSAQTFWLINLNEVNDVTFITIDSDTGLEVANASVYLVSTRYYYSNRTSADGEVNFSMINNEYILTIAHPDYYPYPSLEHYSIDIREIGISSDYTEYISLVPTSKDKYSIFGNITDNNYLPQNATVFIRGNGTFRRVDNVTFYNFTNLSKNNDYFIRATYPGFFDTPEFLIFLITDTRQDIVLENISEVASLTLDINESNNLSNVRAELLDITNQDSYGSVILYTNNSGGAIFIGVIMHHTYRLTLTKPGYKSNTTQLYFAEINQIFDFALIEMENVYTFNGYIYRQGSSPAFGIKGAKISMFGGSNDYQTYTDGNGYFEINDVVYDDYILNISKLGYFSKLFLPLSVYSDVSKNFYLIIEEDVFATGFQVNNNVSLPLEDVAIRITRDDQEDIVATDNNGRAEINLPAGLYEVELSKPGYHTITEEIVISRNGQIFEYMLLIATPRQVRGFGEADFFGFIKEFGWPFMLLAFIMFMAIVLKVEWGALTSRQ